MEDKELIIAGVVMLFFAVFTWSLWALFSHGRKNPRIRHMTKAKIKEYDYQGGRYIPIVEFEYDGELSLCRAEHLYNKTDLSVGSIIDISYCRELMGRKKERDGMPYYRGIAQIEIPSIRAREEKLEKGIIYTTMAISVVLSLLAIIFLLIGLIN